MRHRAERRFRLGAGRAFALYVALYTPGRSSGFAAAAAGVLFVAQWLPDTPPGWGTIRR